MPKRGNNRILLDCTAFHPDYAYGGVSLYQQEILLRLGDEFQFTASYKKIENRILENCVNSEFGTMVSEGRSVSWRDSAARKFRARGGKGAWYPTQFSTWLPILPAVATVHDMAAFRVWRHFSTFGKAYMPTSLLATCINARHLIAISETSAQDLFEIFPWTKSKTVVARHGLPSDIRAATGQNWSAPDLSSQEYSIIFLDGGNARKKLDTAVKAIELNGWKNVRLTVTGSKERSKERVKAALGYSPENINYVGRMSRGDLIRCLSRADILLYPSEFEGFGFPILEAAALGTTPVTFAGGAEKEVGGEFAIYSKSSSVEDLRDALIAAFERCRDQAWKQAISRHALSFTWNDSVSAHEEAFRSAF